MFNLLLLHSGQDGNRCPAFSCSKALCPRLVFCNAAAKNVEKFMNIFFDELRKKRRKMNTVSLDSFFSEEENSKTEKDIECPKDSPDKCSENLEMKRIIRRAISELDEPYRAVITLRELQGFSYDEIAHVTGSSVGTVKSRIARARQKLQTKLKDYL